MYVYAHSQTKFWQESLSQTGNKTLKHVKNLLESNSQPQKETMILYQGSITRIYITAYALETTHSSAS